MAIDESIREVVLVHGLWAKGWWMTHLAGKLSNAGFSVSKFDYATTRSSLDRQAAALYEVAKRDDGSLPHIVAHSMGGLITVHMLVENPFAPSGRIVLMGSPIKGSRAARRVSRWPAGTTLLGAARKTLSDGAQEWPQGREIGMIAGNRAVGLGVLAGGATEHGDGTVLARESLHDDLKDHVEIPSSHTSMLFSVKASVQIVQFLRTGHFSH